MTVDAKTKQRMIDARDHIKAGNLEQARRLLYNVDHPTARKWLEQIDEMEANGQRRPSRNAGASADPFGGAAAAAAARKQQRSSGSIEVILLGVLAVAVVFLGVVVATQMGGDDSGGGDPARAVERTLSALFDGEFERLPSLVCSEQRSTMNSMIAEMDSSLGGMDAAAVMEMVDVDLSGLDYDIASQTETEAYVVITGSITISAFGETQTEPVNNTLGDNRVRVVNEGGEWLMCDDITGL